MVVKTDFKLLEGEELRFEGILKLVKSTFNIQSGTAFLTNKRFVRYKYNDNLRRLIGSLAYLFKEQLDFEILLSDIRAITRAKQGLNPNVLIITTVDGNQVKIICFRLKEWIAAFQEAFDQHPHCGMFDMGQDKWAIQVT